MDEGLVLKASSGKTLTGSIPVPTADTYMKGRTMEQEEKDRLFAEFLTRLENKIEELNAQEVNHKCWVCDEDTTTWSVMIPERGRGNLGLGTPKDETKGRILFFPCCLVHDLMSKDVGLAIKAKLQIKRMVMSN